MKKSISFMICTLFLLAGGICSCSSDDAPVMTKDDITRAMMEEQFPKTDESLEDMPGWLAERIAQYENRDSSAPLEVWICEFFYQGQKYYSILSTYSSMQVLDANGNQVYLDDTEWEDTANWVCIFSGNLAKHPNI